MIQNRTIKVTYIPITFEKANKEFQIWKDRLKKLKPKISKLEYERWIYNLRNVYETEIANVISLEEEKLDKALGEDRSEYGRALGFEYNRHTLGFKFIDEKLSEFEKREPPSTLKTIYYKFLSFFKRETNVHMMNKLIRYAAQDMFDLALSRDEYFIMLQLRKDKYYNPRSGLEIYNNNMY